jgi:cell division septum initiation protein DivIVA
MFREGGAEVSKFVDRMVGRNAPERRAEIDAPAGGPDAGGSVGSPTVSRLADYTVHEGNPKKNPAAPDTAPRTVDADDEAEPVTDYGKLGEHVTSVLEAANKAAAKIREDARANAERVANLSQSEASALLEQARGHAEKLSRESERLCAEAKRESREITQSAEAYVAEKRREAEAEATGILSRARREASEHTRAADERRSALAKDVALSEERLGQLVGGLRNLAAQLEGLVQVEPERANSNSPLARDQDSSLEESLRRSASAPKPSETQA